MIDIINNADNQLPTSKQVIDACSKVWDNVKSNPILYNTKCGEIVNLKNDEFMCNFNVLYNNNKTKPYYHLCGGYVNDDSNTNGLYRCSYDETTSTTYSIIEEIKSGIKKKYVFAGNFTPDSIANRWFAVFNSSIRDGVSVRWR